MTAIYPGSFDPVTRGHLDIIARAAKLTDRLIVAVLQNPAKQPLFTVQERIAHLQALTQPLNIEIDACSGLLAEYAKHREAGLIIRGVRSTTDFAYEVPMVQANRRITENVETVLLVADPRYTFVSAGLVREIAAFGYANAAFNDAVLDEMVPPLIKDALRRKYTARTS